MDRREAGEELYRKKFEVFGLSEHFVFLGRNWETDHGKQCLIKCKDCGSVFYTYNVPEIFKKKLKHLTCPECGKRSDGQTRWTYTADCIDAMSYYTDGHSLKETAEKFGVVEYQISNVVQKTGKSNGRSKKDIAKIQAQREIEKAKQRIIIRLDELGFDYIEGYTDKNSSLAIRCKICYTKIKRSAYTVKYGKMDCPNCSHERTIKEKEEHKRKREEERKAKREAERSRKNPLGLSYYQQKREKRLDEVFTCKGCGKQYTPRIYIKSYGGKTFSNIGYCSKKCRKHDLNRHQVKDSHRHRAKKYGCEYDPAVTLKKLIERDGLRCRICGGMCNPDDHEWTEYFGPSSPTIDHIKPMALGGSHTWDNVQVAHAICNSIKRDSYNEEMTDAS